MLLRNESRVRYSVDIKLVFDDDRIRELELREYDFVQISYRKNGCLKNGTGVIRCIKPYIHTKKFPFCKRESAVITLDMSENHVCCVDKIDLFDIIDIRKVTIDDIEGDNNEGSGENNTEPDFDIIGRCPVGCKIEADGVMIND